MKIKLKFKIIFHLIKFKINKARGMPHILTRPIFEKFYLIKFKINKGALPHILTRPIWGFASSFLSFSVGRWRGRARQANFIKFKIKFKIIFHLIKFKIIFHLIKFRIQFYLIKFKINKGASPHILTRPI